MSSAASRLAQLGALCFAVALAGCGGGGDSAAAPAPTPVTPDPGSSPPPPPGANDAAHATVTSSPSTTYAGGSGAAAIYTTINAARLGAGVGAFTQSAALDRMAGNHLNYLILNNQFGHGETSGLPGYTGNTLGERAAAAQYGWSGLGEVLAETSSSNPNDCINNLLDTVYHQELLMGFYRDVGIAYGQYSSGMFVCVLDLGVASGASPQLPDDNVVAVFPFSGETGVATSFAPHTESPNPMPDVGGASVGFPIQASMVNFGSRSLNTAGAYTVNSFVLKDASGNVVPSRLIAAAGTNAGAGVSFGSDPGGLQPGRIFLVPLSPLASHATYRVQFSGVAGATSLSRSWSFATQ